MIETITTSIFYFKFEENNENDITFCYFNWKGRHCFQPLPMTALMVQAAWFSILLQPQFFVNAKRYSRNVFTTSLRHWGFPQCLYFSWTTLRGKHCRLVFRGLGMYDFEAAFDFSSQIRNGCIRAARRMFYVPLKLSDKSGHATLCNFSFWTLFFSYNHLFSYTGSPLIE